MTRRRGRSTSGPRSRCKKSAAGSKKSAKRQKKKKARSAQSRPPSYGGVVQRRNAGRSLKKRAKLRAALPPEVGGADAILRERNKRRKSNANCAARLSEAGRATVALVQPRRSLTLSRLGKKTRCRLGYPRQRSGESQRRSAPARSGNGEALPRTPQEGSAPS